MMDDKNISVFDDLDQIDVNMYKEERNGFNYLSWSDAWSIVKRKYPETSYEIMTFDGLPYWYDERTGYMVSTTVTIEGITHQMWLPVMDSANHALKSEPYTIKTKYKEIEIASCTMFDINKAIMRCLVKNLAMHGLGMYLYRGEDLPDGADAGGSVDDQPWDADPADLTPINAKQVKQIIDKMTEVWGEHPARHEAFRYLTGYDARNIYSIPSSKFDMVMKKISQTQAEADQTLRDLERLRRKQ